MPNAILPLLFFFVLLTSAASAHTLKLTSLSWPPYAGSELNEGGASVAIVRAAVNAMGHELDISFFPWPRAVRLALADPGYQGYFPEYWYDTDEFIFTHAIGKGPLGLLENRQRPVSWFSLQDLQSYRLGVVQDYVNTPDLDALISAGRINTETVLNDHTNILMVAHNRVDLAVIDPNVLRYLLDHDKELTTVKDRVQMNSRLLTTKELFVALRPTPEGRRWAAIINEGLLKIDVNQILDDYDLR